MHSKKELDQRLKEAGVQPLKKLGQNFLVNPEICKKIVDATLESRPQEICEVGPGLGALTDTLLHSGLPVTLVELDSGLVKYWQSRASKVVHADALRLDWLSLGLQKPALISNLPYSIAASLVIELSEKPLFETMVLMFQKEVAERIQAAQDDEDYGFLSVVAQCYWEIEKVVDAGPQDFFPVPNVGSRVLKFKRIPGPPPSFVKFVKAAFSQRRKKLVKNLEQSYPSSETKKYLAAMGLSEDVRAQELSPTRFKELFMSLQKKSG